MKVGTDGVLVGAWARVLPSDRRLLDVGTGSGLIALMLAQRTAGFSTGSEPFCAAKNPSGGVRKQGVRIIGIDIGEVVEARANADLSPWGDRVEMVQCPVQRFTSPEPFDLIVSNPPFFVDSLLCPDAGRTAARHTVELPFEELRDAVLRLLAAEGRFSVILPFEEGRRFERICRDGLFLSRRIEVRTTPRRAPKRVLMEFQRREPEHVETGALSIGTGAHEEYTAEYRMLTGDFYLKF